MNKKQAAAIETAYRFPEEEVAATLKSDPQTGLTTTEAQARLQQYGKNELPQEPPVPAWRKFLSQFTNPLTILLLVAAGISLLAWFIERENALPYETIAIGAIVLLNGIIGFLQEQQAERSIESLRALSAPTANVMRNQKIETIPSADVVPGDVILLEEGDTVPADARLLEATSLRVSEASLTGESAPVSKRKAPLKEEVGIADQKNMVFSSTAVVSGRGRAMVTMTGAQTEIGKIAGVLHRTTAPLTPFQKELDRIGKILGIIVIGIAVVIGVTILLVDSVRSLSEMVTVLLLAVSLAVAAVPEGLTAVTTLVLSLGMQRMAKRHVIVRKLPAVETLGSTTVICTDKTGTLTRSEMTVRALVTASGRIDFTGSGYQPTGAVLHEKQPLQDSPLKEEGELALRAASLANNATLSLHDKQVDIHGDPTEAALLVAGSRLGQPKEELEQHFPRQSEIPFSSERKLMSTIHEESAQKHLMIFSKGAPDVLLAHCTHEYVGQGEQRPFSQVRREAILAQVETLAKEALRTIGLAMRQMDAQDVQSLPEEPGEWMEQDYTWLGVAGMIDPPRSEVPPAIKEAQGAGIRIIMMTGDHPTTAAAIACELGISEKESRVVTGTELQRMSDEELRTAVSDVSVYARVAPEHKLRVVQALWAHGEVIAMTGDGVNDAPALKTADIGIAMGQTGTDVSKDASDMILVDDNFASIVAAVVEGRSIFTNIQKFLRYLLSSNMGEVLTMFLGVILASVIGLVGEEGSSIVVPLLATQILWINILTDAGPALSLGVDPPDPDVMQKTPRDPRSHIISGRMWFDIVLVGIIMTAGTLFVMDLALPGGLLPGNGSLHHAQTLAFTTLVFFQLFNVFNARSEKRSAFSHLFSNGWIWLAILTSVLLQVAVTYIPFLQQAFGTTPLQLNDWLLCVLIASSVLWIQEIVKGIRRLSSRRTRIERAE